MARGVFTLEIEQALRLGQIDLAVHSLKDLPTEPVPGIVIGAISERIDVSDAVISRSGIRAAGASRGRCHRHQQPPACSPASSHAVGFPAGIDSWQCRNPHSQDHRSQTAPMMPRCWRPLASSASTCSMPRSKNSRWTSCFPPPARVRWRCSAATMIAPSQFLSAIDEPRGPARHQRRAGVSLRSRRRVLRAYRLLRRAALATPAAAWPHRGAGRHRSGRCRSSSASIFDEAGAIAAGAYLR